MDKEPISVRSGHNNNISERTTNYSKGSSSSNWNNKWASSSKFNRILGNIERSIINQFAGSNSSSNNDHHKSCGNKINGKNKQTANQKCKPPSSHTIGNALKSNQNKKAFEQVVQKDPHQIAAKIANKITLQAKSNSATNSANSTRGGAELSTTNNSKTNGNKTTLNKYQQQIVSTMRSNQLLVNNKLSIPPPHANDEARNQNHRILFGSSATAIQTFDTKNSEQHISNPQIQHTNNSSRFRTSVEVDHSKQVNKLETNYIIQRQQQDALGSNSSPASSARSLPTLTTKPLGSQPLSSHTNNNTTTTNNTSKDDEEESGFPNYQSRRSLISTTRSVQDYSLNCEQIQNKPNNMIPMQINQVPIGLPLNYNQQPMYKSATLMPNYHQQQDPHKVKHWQHQQQVITTQNYLNSNNHHHQQLVGAGNQVPILTADTSNNNNPLTRYTNNTNPQLHQFTSTSNNNAQTFNQPFSDNQQQQQLYVLYCPTSIAIVPISSVDNGQQIYANAPPKPRRYQYYDSYQTTHSIPHLTTTSTTSSASANSIQPPPVITVSNGNNPQLLRHQPQQLVFSHPNNFRQSLSHINQQVQHHHQQQQQRIKTLQPSYNTSYVQLPNAHQGLGLKAHDPSIDQTSQSMHYNGSYFKQQPPPRPTLIKSKSNLDAAELMKFKLDKSFYQQQSQTNTLHIQSNRQPIYCSQYDINHRFPDLATQHTPFNYVPQSNLQRSKSVSHLAPEYNSQIINQSNQHRPTDTLLVESLPTYERKHPSVSSASTTNLNYIGLVQSESRQFEQPSRVLSQMNISQKNYLDSTEQQNQQANNRPMFSASSTLRHHPIHRINSCATNLHQISVNQYNRDLSQQQQLHSHLTQQQTRNNIPTNHSLLNSANIVRQSQASNNDIQQQQHSTKHEDSFNKPSSLDDKIRQLLISKDNEIANNVGDSNNLISVVGTSSSNNSRNIDNNVIYQHSSYNNGSNNSSRITHKLFARHHQQAPDIVTMSDRLLNNALPSQEDADNVPNQNVIEQKSLKSLMQKSTSFGQLTNIQVSNQHQQPQPQPQLQQHQRKQQNLSNSNELDNHLTNRIYINEPSQQKMGNKQHGQYQLRVTNQLESSPRKFQQVFEEGSLKNESQNSHLIVDLTTPRVLAKTQTTLLPTNHHNSSWSINQVGLPQPAAVQQNGNSSNQHHILDDKTNQDNVNKFNESSVSISNNNNNINKDANYQIQLLERSAPYYYSDLKSEEQRKALLSIVQQKSLSPPPKLLSRSTDQSSTRLALKSATTSQPSSILNNNDVSLAKQSQDKQSDSSTNSNGNSGQFMRDDEDFIEFLSTGGSSNHRSQFESSQFSASDLNTSTSASESSTSGACNDSLNSVPVISTLPRHLFPNGTSSSATATTITTTTTTGILKNSGMNKSGIVSNNNSISLSNDNKMDANKKDKVKDVRQALGDSKNCEVVVNEETNNQFNNVLGNVIDVDICPINNLSQCSPVNNQASCLN